LSRGARIFEEIEGAKPDVLVVYSYMGGTPQDVIEEAKKKKSHC